MILFLFGQKNVLFSQFLVKLVPSKVPSPAHAHQRRKFATKNLFTFLKMLSNYIVGNHKFVLFVDDAGIERRSEMITDKLLSEQNVTYEKFNGSFEITSKTAVVLPPVSKLSLSHDPSSIFAMIQTLKLDRNVTQVFAWATSKNISSLFVIPFLEHMSSVVVTIKSNKLSILTKRKFGSVKLREYQHELTQDRWTTSIKEVKSEEPKTIQNEIAVINPESLGTFKIGEFNSTEMEAKKNLKLPYEIM